MADRVNMMQNMPAASFEDMTQVRPKTVDEVRDAVDTAVKSAAGYAKDVSLCASKSAQVAIGQPTADKAAPTESLAASVAEKADMPSAKPSYDALSAGRGSIGKTEPEAGVEDPELGG